METSRIEPRVQSVNQRAGQPTVIYMSYQLSNYKHYINRIKFSIVQKLLLANLYLLVNYHVPQVDAFKERLQAFSSPDLDIAFGHYKSLDEELDSNVTGDIFLFAITIVLMMTYAGLATLSSR